MPPPLTKEQQALAAAVWPSALKMASGFMRKTGWVQSHAMSPAASDLAADAVVSMAQSRLTAGARGPTPLVMGVLRTCMARRYADMMRVAGKPKRRYGPTEPLVDVEACDPPVGSDLEYADLLDRLRREVTSPSTAATFSVAWQTGTRLKASETIARLDAAGVPAVKESRISSRLSDAYCYIREAVARGDLQL